ncbi:MAG TPA: hypothetical protein VLM85_25655 [Polyangiaceae bacterium]|nr:hypothetical protein [Polyangiaceae bacterium]
MKTKATRRTLALFALGAFALGGCELIAEFDRSKIDAGSLDGSFPDVSQPDVSQPDVNQPDAPADTGTDAGSDAADAAADVVDAGSDAADAAADVVDAGSDAGADASDAASDATADADATAAMLAISPTPQDFGTVGADASVSANIIFTVTNNGGSTSGTLTASITGGDSVDFALGTDTCTSTTLGPASSCTVAVHFAPLTTGTKSTTLQVTDGTTTANATLTGTAN